MGSYKFEFVLINGELIDQIDTYDEYGLRIMTTNASIALDSKGNRIPGSTLKRKSIAGSNHNTDLEIMSDPEVIAYPTGMVMYRDDDFTDDAYQCLCYILYNFATSNSSKSWNPWTHYMIIKGYPYKVWD